MDLDLDVDFGEEYGLGLTVTVIRDQRILGMAYDTAAIC